MQRFYSTALIHYIAVFFLFACQGSNAELYYFPEFFFKLYDFGGQTTGSTGLQSFKRKISSRHVVHFNDTVVLC